MKLHWLLPSTVGSIVLLSSPAVAAKLESWRFDANQNRLEINTNSAVQPQAQLIFNPTRLVIDLPSTTFGRPQFTQPVGGAVRAVRVGQFDPQTTRLVVELSPGYTLDPQQVQFENVSASRWRVKLPTPTAEARVERSLSRSLPPQAQAASSARNIYNVVTLDSDANTKPEFSNQVAQSTPGRTQIENLQVTGDGLFLRTNGGNPQVKINRSRDRNTIFMDIADASLSPSLTQLNQEINRHGVSRVELTALNSQPPGVRMTLRVDKRSPDWQATNSSAGGLVVLPSRVVRLPGNNSNNSHNNGSPPPTTRNLPVAINSPAIIQSVELANNDTQLLIRGDKTVNATSGWDRSSGLFRITIPNAKLAANVTGPNFSANSPILRVRLQPQDNTVVVLVQAATGVQIGELNQVSNQLLALQLQGSRQARVSPPVAFPPLPPPTQGQLPSPTAPPPPRSQPAPRPVPKTRAIVMIDPGHGGKDPGAIGIGSLREKDVILPISKRIAAILQQNGVQAVLTRDSDYFVSLQGRVDLAQRANADLFVSIHANAISMSRPDVNGLETYYYDSGQSLASSIHRSITQNVTIRDRKVRRARFYVLRKSSMPSVLVEVGFVTGAEDAARLRTTAYQNQMADAIARGILQHLQRR
ncbi:MULTISPECIES: N-acetylmuramoyl-L-alanine amidase [Cyanophyceae]|uniref:N-acetylmuramoyl-L-alanine amidase n=1 Tax=Cyanophyceae TaxID=3028117 RepID=UPI00232F94E5|nr:MULTISPECIES: N-acetylmuramoyl-L-alanine amidase [Cyanophyceae]MDB9304755.1 N-acetylmuramoyl-L-alanine amidase [Nodularia spumigena CS-591/12]MDB9337963.1 N-acetylmuramoyl-L-alanine amidase [Nodularia spumigena CS-589/07]MDB9345239.1 N-acetylmuramoyl-L-alanine amidase [Nodularia spumigena CS-588/06]MDB9369982.1 N-acetylmuramoyl-L-alanine amidase [Nodularia spumigena CS-586/05]MDB9400153.1 N-acetylmuramoyl-L-alanine amidase [Microcystis aeruginosa CS-567/02-A1]